MKNKLILGLWRFMLKVPPSLWEKQMAKAKKKFDQETRFMTEDHRLVHHFVVRELPFLGRPMPPDYAAEGLEMDPGRVTAILDDLEKHMTYLFRNEKGEVIWAYPVTVDKTPHQVTFDTGEQLFAA